MIKNKLFLDNTSLCFTPLFDFHMNAYTWNVLRDLLGVNSWDEVVQVKSYISDICDDSPLITPYTNPVLFDETGKFRFYKNYIWGVKCAVMKHKLENGGWGTIFYVKLKNLGLCG